MGSSLESPKMVEVLGRLFKATDEGDPDVLEGIRSKYGDALGKLPARARADAMAALACSTWAFAPSIRMSEGELHTAPLGFSDYSQSPS